MEWKRWMEGEHTSGRSLCKAEIHGPSILIFLQYRNWHKMKLRIIVGECHAIFAWIKYVIRLRWHFIIFFLSSVSRSFMFKLKFSISIYVSFLSLSRALCLMWNSQPLLFSHPPSHFVSLLLHSPRVPMLFFLSLFHKKRRLFGFYYLPLIFAFPL